MTDQPDIDVTPEMIEAGREHVCSAVLYEDLSDERIAAIYRAMYAARPRETPASETFGELCERIRIEGVQSYTGQQRSTHKRS